MHSNQTMVRGRDRKNIIQAVKRFLNAIDIGSYDIINRHFVEKLISERTTDMMFQSCIQREETSLLDTKFTKLKPQSVRSQLTHFNKFLLFLEYHRLLEPQEKDQFCAMINRWRRHLQRYAHPSKQAPLVDVKSLGLKQLYEDTLDCLMNKPETIADCQSAIKARDVTVCKVAKNWGKRPGELASIAVYGVKNPVRQELTYALEASPKMPSKVSHKYGRFVLYVSEDIFNMLRQYLMYVRPILSGTNIVDDWDILWIKRGGEPLSSKCIRDITIRGIQSGTSEIRVTPMSIRHTLSNLANIAQKKGEHSPEGSNKWSGFSEAMAFSMRHSIDVHNDIYVRTARPLLQSRTDTIESKLLNGEDLTTDDAESVSDVAIHTAMLPSHNDIMPNPVTNPVSNIFPKEYGTPPGNKSTYQYIQDLYNGTFSYDTNTSASMLRCQLESHPELKPLILANLGIESFKSMYKLQGKATTYKQFLRRHYARFLPQPAIGTN